MWSIQSLEVSENEYRLTTDKDYVVGRKNCDIIINNDKSVSKKHATLRVNHSESNLGNPNCKPDLYIQDFSKFGTYINDVQVKEKQCIVDGDVIKFGGLNSIWKVKYQPLIVIISSLDELEKQKISELIYKLGGHLVSKWEKENTHLIMSNLVLNIKVVHALITAKPIVTPAYFEELLKSVQNKTPIPSVNNFLPPLQEPSLKDCQVDFSPSECRSCLFVGKKFLLSSPKQFRKFSVPIRFGGGEAILLTAPPSSYLLLRPGVCFVTESPESTNHSASTSWVSDVINTLRRNSKRVISESEIALAVVYSSTEKYCNSDSVSLTSQPTLHVASQSQSQAPFAPDSLDNLDNNFDNLDIEVIEKIPPKVPETKLTSVNSSMEKRTPNTRKHYRDEESQMIDSIAKVARVEIDDGDGDGDDNDNDDDLFSPAVLDQERSVQIMEVEKPEPEIIDLDHLIVSASQETIQYQSESESEFPDADDEENDNSSQNWLKRNLSASKCTSNEDQKTYVVVEIKPLLRKQIEHYSVTFSESSRNFKKFKKVQPFRSNKDRLSLITSGRNDHIDASELISSDEEDKNDRLTTDQGTQEEDLFEWVPKML